MASTPQFPSTILPIVASIANADATSFKTIAAAQAAGQRLDSLCISNSDAATAYVVQLAVQVSGVDYVIGEVTVPIGAGTNSSAKSVAAFNTTDLPFLAYTENYSLYLGAGEALRARSKTTVSGVNTLQFVGVGGSY